MFGGFRGYQQLSKVEALKRHPNLQNNLMVVKMLYKSDCKNRYFYLIKLKYQMFAFKVIVGPGT